MAEKRHKNKSYMQLPLYDFPDGCLWAGDLTIAGSAKREHEKVTDNALVELGDETVQFSHHI